jgi:hypothetical protein
MKISQITNNSRIDDAVRMVQKLGKGALLAKADIKSAFRLLRIWPGDFDQLGFSFSGNFYFDKCLPMGAEVSMRNLTNQLLTESPAKWCSCSPIKVVFAALIQLISRMEVSTPSQLCRIISLKTSGI